VSQSDPYGDWDAAYVLGALTVQQRHEYEDHLAGCPDCRSAVGELAAMPGLLAQLPAAEAIALSDHGSDPGAGPVPDSIRDFTPPRRLGARTRLLLVAAVVAALIIGGIGGFLVHSAVTPTPPGRGSSVLVAFAAQRPTGLMATAKLTQAKSGTKVDLDCMYALHAPGNQGSVDLTLQTVDDAGRKDKIWTWPAGPGDHTTYPGWSRLPLDKIRSLQILDADNGAVVMTAAVN